MAPGFVDPPISLERKDTTMTFAELTDMLMGWPLVESSTSYGTPSFKVRGKLLTRLREDGDSLLIKGVPPEERAMLVEAEPDLYYYTDHYRDYPMVLIRLSRADSRTVAAMVQRTYRDLLPKPRKRQLT
jgi:hypothetical protein